MFLVHCTSWHQDLSTTEVWRWYLIVFVLCSGQNYDGRMNSGPLAQIHVNNKSNLTCCLCVFTIQPRLHDILYVYHENTMHNSLFTCNVWLLYHFYTEQIIHLMTQAWYFMHIALCLLFNFSRFFVICWPFSKPTFWKILPGRYHQSLMRCDFFLFIL